MGSENYSNYYIEILTATMNDAIIRNVSLQAQMKAINEVIDAQSKQLDEANGTIDYFKNQLEITKSNNGKDNDSYITSLQAELQHNKDQVNNLNRQINEVNSMRSEYENVKQQVAHLDTFRNELIKERDLHQQTRNNYELQIEELNIQIEKLKSSPVKKQKVVEKETTQEATKDGGNF
jgi:chromosome segregation ATPase